MSKKRILGVIGLGHVGAHAAYALAVQGIADELILVDKNAAEASRARYRTCATRRRTCRTGSRSAQAISRISARAT